MIPLKLELSNFLSYRETAVLDFNGIHLACISGANGAGKSSILDGMMWALFGKSRSKSDDDLVNRVAAIDGKAAEVKLTFDLEGSVYRVTRRRRARKSSMLELNIATDFDENKQPLKWKTLSETKIRETQLAIETLLRMNYDTFINSSFLLQGKADEFTTKSPNRRKEILADLLGVSVWEQYRETAVSRRKQEDGRVALLDAQLAEIETELTEEDVRQERLKAAQASFEQIAAQLADKEKLLNQQRHTETAVKQQKQLLTTLTDTLKRSQQSITNLQSKANARSNEIKQHQAVLDKADGTNNDYAQWQQADTEVQAWQTKANQFNQYQQAKREPELAIAEEKSRLTQRQQELITQETAVNAAKAEQATATAQLTATRTQLKEGAATLTTLAAQEAAWHEAKSALQTVESERKLLAQEAGQLQKQAQQIKQLEMEKTAVSHNATAAEVSLLELTAQLATFKEKNDLFVTSRADADGLDAEQPRLREEMEKLKKRIDQLAASDEGSCPLCGQPLTPSHRQEVLAELRVEGTNSGDRFRQNQQRIATLRTSVKQLQAELKEQPRLQKNEQTQQNRLTRAQAKLEEIEVAVAEWQKTGQPRLAALEKLLADETAVTTHKQQVVQLETAVKQKPAIEAAQRQQQQQLSQTEARLAEIKRMLASWKSEGQPAFAETRHALENETYAPDAKGKLAQINAEVEQLGYDAAAHSAATQSKTAVKTAPERYQALKQAEAAIEPLQTAVFDLTQQIDEQKSSLTELAVQQKAAQESVTQLEADSGDLERIEDAVFKLRETQIEANRKVGAAQQRLDVLKDLRQRRTKLNENRATMTQLVQRLKLLEKACGRKGVQALLIERALPDIEDSANELLDRLTNGEMRIRFDTQRKLKSRDALAETLDIRIVDNAGERPYDNYSGGEKFRVNFAIRLALSQVLTKRSGARLQTLVIDEGFGSQDVNGRQRLIEAINTIQDDFSRILIITHVDELRDAFPTRIEVEKQSTGSTINIS